jgi:hypothetical protein
MAFIKKIFSEERGPRRVYQEDYAKADVRKALGYDGGM